MSSIILFQMFGTPSLYGFAVFVLMLSIEDAKILLLCERSYFGNYIDVVTYIVADVVKVDVVAVFLIVSVTVNVAFVTIV
jgi:hypothetical protein